MTDIKRICITDCETTTKLVRQIQIFVGDMWLHSDLVSDRQVLLAKRMADENGITLEIHPTNVADVIA